MARAGFRIAVVGATGAVGKATLEALSASSIRVAQILAVATDRSVSADVEFRDEIVPVDAELPSLRGLDLLLVCAPPGVALEVAREALRAEVPTIDLSGAFSLAAEVPLRVAAWDDAVAAKAPLVALPAAPALAWSLVLRPLADRAGLSRVQATLLDSAAVAGVRGTEALVHESLALFNQQDLPEPTVFGRPVAFDCGPGAGDDAGREERAAAELGRLLGSDVGVHVTGVQVPTFLGLGSVLHLTTREPLGVDEARALLEKAPGVELWSDDVAGPSLRAAVGRDEVLVGRLRSDPTTTHGLCLWAATDPACLAAANAVALAEARLGSAETPAV